MRRRPRPRAAAAAGASASRPGPLSRRRSGRPRSETPPSTCPRTCCTAGPSPVPLASRRTSSRARRLRHRRRCPRRRLVRPGRAARRSRATRSGLRGRRRRPRSCRWWTRCSRPSDPAARASMWSLPSPDGFHGKKSTHLRSKPCLLFLMENLRSGHLMYIWGLEIPS
uniref:Uncharacterized protein n=1 Tax=Arundo donax TaxID=35708 RepID=A0A0A9BMB0_ARUDO